MLCNEWGNDDTQNLRMVEKERNWGVRLRNRAKGGGKDEAHWKKKREVQMVIRKGETRIEERSGCETRKEMYVCVKARGKGGDAIGRKYR